MKAELDRRRPLTSGELKRLHDEFIVEFTYNTNAIEGIHPFVDGNGRTGRLILNLMLMQAGYPPIDVKFVDRRKYYTCFDSYYLDKDASPMVTMVGEYVKERLGQYLRLLED